MPQLIVLLAAMLAAAFLPGIAFLVLMGCAAWGAWGYLVQSRRDVAMAFLIAVSVIILVPVLRQIRIEPFPADTDTHRAPLAVTPRNRHPMRPMTSTTGAPATIPSPEQCY